MYAVGLQSGEGEEGVERGPKATIGSSSASAQMDQRSASSHRQDRQGVYLKIGLMDQGVASSSLQGRDDYAKIDLMDRCAKQSYLWERLVYVKIVLMDQGAASANLQVREVYTTLKQVKSMSIQVHVRGSLKIVTLFTCRTSHHLNSITTLSLLHHCVLSIVCFTLWVVFLNSSDCH